MKKPVRFKKGQRVKHIGLGAYASVVEDSEETTTMIKWDDWNTTKRGKPVTYKGGTIKVMTHQLKLVK